MDRELERSMLAYYDARAEEYDELYIGKLPAASGVMSQYSIDSRALADAVARACRGRIIDAPCGTAFWLPAYAGRAEAVTLVDQSEGMLEQARDRVRVAGLESRCTLQQANLLSDPWPHAGFDTFVCGFFLSHVEEEDECIFLERARGALGPGGVMVVLDSCWNEQRARSRPRAGLLRRQLNDGRHFDIYKRYFDRDDVERLGRAFGGGSEMLYEGDVFMAFILRPSDPA